MDLRPLRSLARTEENVSLEIVEQSLMKKRDILDTIGGTPMAEIERMSPKKDVHIFAKLEGSNPTGSLKDRIAKYMIERAEAEGTLTHDKIILEPTSGNTGIALAAIRLSAIIHIV